MAWPTKKLGELSDISRGSSPRPICDTKYFEGGQIPWVKIADATKSGKFLYETKEHVNDFGASFSRRLPPGTILVAASGTLGYTQILGVEGCAHDGWLILQNLKNLDRDYAYYALKTLERHFSNSGSGAAIQNINTDILRQAEIPYPPLPVQRRIAGILSAYDELIENSQRRIQILESMARALYREWFVELRFPGQKNESVIELETGVVPDRWKNGRLDSFLEVLETGNRPKGGVADIKKGIPSVGAESITGIGQFDFTKTKYVPHDYFASMRSGIVQDRDVLVYKDGGQPGNFRPHVTLFGSGFPYEVMTINSHVYRLRARPGISQEFLYFYLSSESVFGWMRMHGRGAAIPGLTRDDLKRLPFFQPDEPTLRRFDMFVQPIVSEILALARQAENLRRTRELLLPRLLSCSAKPAPSKTNCSNL